MRLKPISDIPLPVRNESVETAPAPACRACRGMAVVVREYQPGYSSPRVVHDVPGQPKRVSGGQPVVTSIATPCLHCEPGLRRHGLPGDLCGWARPGRVCQLCGAVGGARSADGGLLPRGEQKAEAFVPPDWSPDSVA